MNYPLYSVRDLKADGFAPPRVYVNEQVAIRDFSYRLHNDDSLGFSPSDYDLYKIGEFDSHTGQITPLDLPVMVINGGQLF